MKPGARIELAEGGRAVRHPGKAVVVSIGSSRAQVSPEAVEPRYSPIHGRGLFARIDLPARRKLGELSGRLVRLPEARRGIERLPVIYLVELSRRCALDCRDGNAFKHLNHSCEPNCFLRVVRRVVEVYTLSKIAMGAELTIDYGLTPHRHGMDCHCGNRNCRRRI
jgi:SET domain-containing protein